MTERGSSVAPSLDELVAEARRGQETAWVELVHRLERVVWKTVTMCTGDVELRNEAFAATWLRLAERLGSIREPSKLPGWLVTTATNEVRHLVRQRSYAHVLVDWTEQADLCGALLEQMHSRAAELDGDLLRAEAAAAVRQAFAQLDDECRIILTVLVMDQSLTYQEASVALGRPVGALGPTRRRCLERLRRQPSLRRLLEVDGSAGI